MDDLSTSRRGSILFWILGFMLLAFIALYFLNIFFTEVDETAKEYADKYIQDSDTIVVELPNPQTTRQLNIEFETYHIPLSRYGGKGDNKVYYRYIFYSKKYNRYLALVTFWGYNLHYDPYIKGKDLEISRINLIEQDVSISARVNRIQWNDPSYGTKDNPMPIFWKHTLDYYGGMEDVATISDEINKIFVSEYLFRFLPKEEFERLYGEPSK